MHSDDHETLDEFLKRGGKITKVDAKANATKGFGYVSKIYETNGLVK